MYIFLINLFFIFIISLFLGSFLGVVVDRLYRGEQFIKGRSYCEACGHELVPRDLIPLVSYLFNGGKCRYCGKRISPTLPFFELFTAISVTSYLYYTHGIEITTTGIILGLLLIILLLIVFFADLKYSIIFDTSLVLLLALYVGGFALFWSGVDFGSFNVVFMNLETHLISAIWLFLFFTILYYGTKKKGIGDGDMYLAGLLGLYLTFPQSLVMWFVAFLTGATVGVILLLLKKKKMRQAIPFGPFLVIGFAYSFVYGVSIVTAYLQLLGV